jgi:hypothetical protein
MAKTRQKFAPDFMIMMRRKEEDTRQIYEEKTKSDSTLQKYLNFQHSTDARIDRNRSTIQTEMMRKQMEDELNARRSRLALMLEDEVGILLSLNFRAAYIVSSRKRYTPQSCRLWRKLLICVVTVSSPEPGMFPQKV